MEHVGGWVLYGILMPEPGVILCLWTVESGTYVHGTIKTSRYYVVAYFTFALLSSIHVHSDFF